jgi:hypothetical protein
MTSAQSPSAPGGGLLSKEEAAVGTHSARSSGQTTSPEEGNNFETPGKGEAVTGSH